MEYPCECSSFNCNAFVDVSHEIGKELAEGRSLVIIDGCTVGSPEGDVLIEKREGYGLYGESHFF